MGIRGGRPSDSQSPPLIELELLDVRPNTRRVPVTQGPVRRDGAPDRRPRPRAGSVALGVAAVFAVGALVAMPRGDGEAESTPATTAPTTTLVAPATVTPIATAPTTAPTSTTVAVVTVPTTTSRAPGPVLGVARGWSLVSFNRSSLTVVDLDTGGVTTTRDQSRQQGGAERPIVLSDRVVYTWSDPRLPEPSPSVWSQRLRDESPVRIIDRAWTIASSSRAGFFWVVPTPVPASGVRVVEIDVTGAPATTLTIPAGLQIVGPSADGLWLTGSGRIYSLSRAGQLRSVAVGRLVDASVPGAVFENCPPATLCSLAVAKADGSISTVGPSPDLPLVRDEFGGSSILSPDGRWLLLKNGVIDRNTGVQVRHVFTIESWRWSPDSTWLFLESRNDGPLAWNVREQRFVSLPALVENATITGVAAS